MTDDPKKDDVEEVSAEAAEDPGVAAPEPDTDTVVPDKPAKKAAAKRAVRESRGAPEGPEPAAKKKAAANKDDEEAKPVAKKKAAAKKKATDDEDEATAKKPAAKKKAAAKKDAEEAKPAKEAKRPARRRRDEERAVPVGLTVRAQAKYVRTSARKARLVCDHIRGKDVVEARAILAFTPRGAAKPWLKLLESAVANAEHNHELVGEELRIESVHADEGPTLKRFRPRAMGRATRIRKRTSHLTITLTPKES
jgi:ribosomal protein L22